MAWNLGSKAGWFNKIVMQSLQLIYSLMAYSEAMVGRAWRKWKYLVQLAGHFQFIQWTENCTSLFKGKAEGNDKTKSMANQKNTDTSSNLEFGPKGKKSKIKLDRLSIVDQRQSLNNLFQMPYKANIC